MEERWEEKREKRGGLEREGRGSPPPPFQIPGSASCEVSVVAGANELGM